MHRAFQLTDTPLLAKTLLLRLRLVVRQLDDLRVPVDTALMRWLPPVQRPQSLTRAEADIAQVERVTSLVCNRWRLTRTTCLPRALIRARLLRERGIDARIHIGVNQVEEFRAHAWISVNAQPLMETGALDYTEIMQLPSAGPPK